MRRIDADALKIALDTFATLVGFGGLYDRGQVMGCIDAAPTVGGWISVKDRLPEERINPLTQDFQNVICFCDFGGRPKRTDIRVYGFGKRAWENESHFWHGQQIMDGVITHWMPLPEPPIEEKMEAQ